MNDEQTTKTSETLEEFNRRAYLADLARLRDFTPDEDRPGWWPKGVTKLGH